MNTCTSLVALCLVVSTCYGLDSNLWPTHGDRRLETPSCNSTVRYRWMSRDSYGRPNGDYSLDTPGWLFHSKEGYGVQYGYGRRYERRQHYSPYIIPNEQLLERWITELNDSYPYPIYAGTVPIWISYFYNQYCVRDQC